MFVFVFVLNADTLYVTFCTTFSRLASSKCAAHGAATAAFIQSVLCKTTCMYQNVSKSFLSQGFGQSYPFASLAVSIALKLSLADPESENKKGLPK